MVAAWPRTMSSGSGRSSQTGLRFDEAFHILAADERDVLAEALR